LKHIFPNFRARVRTAISGGVETLTTWENILDEFLIGNQVIRDEFITKFLSFLHSQFTSEWYIVLRR